MRLLILGGTSEASALARALVGDPRVMPTLSLAGRTIAPVLPPIPYRIGGFGGVAGLVDHCRSQAIDALIDATHPFAAQMTDHAYRATAQCGIACLRIDRPAWRPEAGDRWINVADMSAAVRVLGDVPRRVFLTIGQQELAPFRAAPWHHYLIRSVDPPPPELLPPDATIIAARGPFAVEDERALLIAHRIATIVTKNSGAIATAAKLAAARDLGLPVVMIDRPASPPMATVPDVAGALEWLEARHAASIRRGV
ncbi:MAG: cobalt-precorrin-6A reductase [Acidiphilium sp.]|nr:cobalt-precorrin-6A reductase [Acidiphilium sp.]MDD4935580.1 cobalt-precorrin-6A reductase [Acidiphilium sp.]